MGPVRELRLQRKKTCLFCMCRGGRVYKRPLRLTSAHFTEDTTDAEISIQAHVHDMSLFYSQGVSLGEPSHSRLALQVSPTWEASTHV